LEYKKSYPAYKGWIIAKTVVTTHDYNPYLKLFTVRVNDNYSLVFDLKKLLGLEKQRAIQDFRKRVANQLGIIHEDFGVCGVCQQSAGNVPASIFYRNAVAFLDKIS